jgi:5-methylcytosine-specific restriction endonuclease McrA
VSFTKEIATCLICSKEFPVRRGNPGKYCSRKCNGHATRANAPRADGEWLREQYIEKKLTCKAIGLLVGKDAKTILTWLRHYGIPTRPRGHDISHIAYWLRGEPSPLLGKKMPDSQRQKLREHSIRTGRVPFDPSVGSYMKGRKGAETPNWRGGVSPERQSFYATDEWKAVALFVRNRDDFRCQRCQYRHGKGIKRRGLDIHHIVSFMVRELRAEPTNLILLCEPCHYWVHSSENVNRDFIKEPLCASA